MSYVIGVVLVVAFLVSMLSKSLDISGFAALLVLLGIPVGIYFIRAAVVGFYIDGFRHDKRHADDERNPATKRALFAELADTIEHSKYRYEILHRLGFYSVEELRRAGDLAVDMCLVVQPMVDRVEECKQIARESDDAQVIAEVLYEAWDLLNALEREARKLSPDGPLEIQGNIAEVKQEVLGMMAERAIKLPAKVVI